MEDKHIITEGKQKKLRDAESRIFYLFAASPGIKEASLARHFIQLPGVPDGDIAVLEGNPGLLRVVRERWPSCQVVPAPKARTGIKKLLGKVSRLVLFWDGEELTRLLFESRVAATPTKLIPIPITRVVNRKLTSDYDVYIGRGSPFGNPFAISRSEDGPDRADVIERYRDYFFEKMESDPTFRTSVLALRGLRLACYCKPEACHGDIIADYLNKRPESLASNTGEGFDGIEAHCVLGQVAQARWQVRGRSRDCGRLVGPMGTPRKQATRP
jgi:hypothetical protein